MLGDCATLYNAALQERRDAYRYAGVTVRLYDQMRGLTGVRADDSALAGVSVNVQRGVLRRLDFAMSSFFRRIKSGQKPGYPRFKPRSRYTTIEIADPSPSMVRRVEEGNKASVRVKGLPVIRLRPRRTLPPSEQLRSLRIVQRPSGYVVDMTYEIDIEETRWGRRVPPGPLDDGQNTTREGVPPRDVDAPPVGIDLGVNNRLALSDGRMIEPRVHDRTRETRLRQAVSRAHKGSNTRRKRVRMLGRETRRNVVRNRNAVHELTTAIVERYGHIAMERLRIANMTRTARGTIEEPGVNVRAKSGLNREILNQTWGLIREQLRYKAEWAGREFREVDPKYTSRLCHVCGGMTPQSEYRSYRCGICGAECDRDTNAARNILVRSIGSGLGQGLRPTSSVGGENHIDAGLG